ncbi:hypothetical protein [Stenoxybacter acetivorans]|uniref:hypothetical protein n=1 Tax=Stenoxybacter acetivorans TaxID=422441 RepID=UPI000567BBA8|nr:hypothetical protein [Stenoxybacter acetivorans]
MGVAANLSLFSGSLKHKNSCGDFSQAIVSSLFTIAIFKPSYPLWKWLTVSVSFFRHNNRSIYRYVFRLPEA